MGEVFAGRYELADPIGRGGVGAMWRAWDHRRRRYVAAKVLQQRDAHSLLRFVREQALRIDHPHVLAPASWAADDDQVLFTMDLVAGGSLVHLVGDYGPLPPAFVRTLLDQLLSGLAAVHAEGVVHRDVKPANVLLEATGTGLPRLRLSDFGIAMRLGEPRLTDTNLVVGTPGYIAPEQLMGAEPGFPADLFAVGLVALYLLQGAKPDARALVEHFAEHGTPSAPQGIPEPLWQVVASLLQPDPQARFRTATGARKALAAAAELLPEPGPDDELIEIFDQLGPLPPGFAPDGPLKRSPGVAVAYTTESAETSRGTRPGTPTGVGETDGTGTPGETKAGTLGGPRTPGEAPAPGGAGALEGAGVSGTPGGPGTPDGFGTVNGAGAASGPGMSDGGGRPSGTGGFGEGGMPHGPGAPGGARTPRPRGTPGAGMPWSGTPDRSSTPYEPGIPERPGASEASHGPGAHHGPGTPYEPGIPERPGASEASRGPGAHHGPGTPDGAGTPGRAVTPGRSATRGTAGAPGGGGVPAAPGASGRPSWGPDASFVPAPPDTGSVASRGAEATGSGPRSDPRQQPSAPPTTDREGRLDQPAATAAPAPGPPPPHQPVPGLLPGDGHAAGQPFTMSDTGSFHLPPPQVSASHPAAGQVSPHEPTHVLPPPGPGAAWRAAGTVAPAMRQHPEASTASYTAEVPQVPVPAHGASRHRAARPRRPGPPASVAVPLLVLALACYAVGFWALVRL